MTSIGELSFWNCSGLTAVHIPSSVTSIGDEAFWGCIALTSVHIPSGVTSIGDTAFWDCRSLTAVEIPSSVESIERGAFRYCDNLTAVHIPSGVTSIGRQVFVSCSSLESVHIPSGVTSIGWGVFWGCSSLMGVEIPSSVTSVGDEVFMDCTNLHFIVTENPLLREASPEYKSYWGINATCEIIRPSELLEKSEVQERLRVFGNIELTDEQKVFLYLNHHRWKQLSVEELREHVGDAPLELLKALDHDKWEMAKNLRDLAVGVVGKAKSDNSEELGQTFWQSTSFSTIKNISLWSTLAQTAKPDHTIPGDTVSKK